jgi:hypothetical protein
VKDINKKQNKKVAERMKLHAKLRNKPTALKKSSPMTHTRTKPPKAERLKLKRERLLKNRLARGQRVLSMIKDLANDVKVQISGKKET